VKCIDKSRSKQFQHESFQESGFVGQNPSQQFVRQCRVVRSHRLGDRFHRMLFDGLWRIVSIDSPALFFSLCPDAKILVFRELAE
jgi:hypothetical protein